MAINLFYDTYQYLMISYAFHDQCFATLFNLSAPAFPDFTGSSTRLDIRAFTPTFHCQVTDNTCAAEGDPAKLRTIYAEKVLEQARMIDRLSDYINGS